MLSNIAIAFAGCLLAMCALSEASPMETKRANQLHHITARQANFMCNVDSDCNPSNATGNAIPNGWVKCTNKVCVCSGSCFTLNTTTNRCGYSTCGSYNNGTYICTPAIGSKSQRTAFLLSFFVMPTGAANFYIGQNGLGGAQLAILLLSIVLCCASCCIKTCSKIGGASEEGGGGGGFACLCLCLSCGTGLLSLAISLVSFAWWIAELVIFGQNQRLAGNGCPLVSDL